MAAPNIRCGFFVENKELEKNIFEVAFCNVVCYNIKIGIECRLIVRL
jgi:hypothetical protein